MEVKWKKISRKKLSFFFLFFLETFSVEIVEELTLPSITMLTKNYLIPPPTPSLMKKEHSCEHWSSRIVNFFPFSFQKIDNSKISQIVDYQFKLFWWHLLPRIWSVSIFLLKYDVYSIYSAKMKTWSINCYLYFDIYVWSDLTESPPTYTTDLWYLVTKNNKGK